MVAQATGTPIDRVAPMTARPPVRPVPLAALAALRDATLHQNGREAKESEGDSE
jgi:hypothetical protein